MVFQTCYPASSGGQYSRACPPYMSLSERRYNSHESRGGIAMADTQVEADSQPQRKRISLACGRCRKRKIRCSGDMGDGQPCTNCKNAGSEPCKFLRMMSQEAQLKGNAATASFPYNSQDSRACASRTFSQNVQQYQQDQPALSSADMLTTYRAASPYGYGAKTFYPAMAGYGAAYPDEYVDYGLGYPTQPILPQDPVSVVPYSWASRPKPPAASSAASPPGIYLDADASYATYQHPALHHHRGCSISGDSPSNFSFSGLAAHLPPASASDRLLPNPVSRVPHPLPLKPAAATAAAESTASYGPSFASHRHQHQHQHVYQESYPTAQRSAATTYPGSESPFEAQQVVTAYTSNTGGGYARRGSGSSCSAESSAGYLGDAEGTRVGGERR